MGISNDTPNKDNASPLLNQPLLKHSPHEGTTQDTTRHHFCAGFSNLLEKQASANFAMVMSTGIVSVALHLLGWQSLAMLLFVVNTILFLLLAVLYPLRLFRYPAAMKADFKSHGAGPGFLTIVAGTCILGNQFALLGHDPGTAMALFWLGTLLWLGLLWGVFYQIFVSEPKPPLAKGINGAWLLATVSTQAIVILGTILSPHAGWHTDMALFLLAGLFTLGFMLYILVICLIFYRYTFKELAAEDLSPTYWINAGAVAITTLAGSELILHAAESPVLRDLLPFLKGMTLMAWSTATFWIPMLFLLGFWRHVCKGFPVAYNPAYWGMVFPLGMYTACTFMIAKAFDLAPLLRVPEAFIFIALAAWLGTFTGMIRVTWRGIRGK